MIKDNLLRERKSPLCLTLREIASESGVGRCCLGVSVSSWEQMLLKVQAQLSELGQALGTVRASGSWLHMRYIQGVIFPAQGAPQTDEIR